MPLRIKRYSNTLWNSFESSENLRNIWKQFEILGNTLKLSKNPLYCSEIVRKPLVSLKISENIWKSLENLRNLWNPPEFSGALGSCLKPSETFWKCSEILWIYLKHSKISATLWNLLRNGARVITKRGSYFLLHIGARVVKKRGSLMDDHFITKWGKDYYKMRQRLLQNGVAFEDYYVTG